MNKTDTFDKGYNTKPCVEYNGLVGTFEMFAKLERPEFKVNLIQLDYYKQHCNPRPSFLKRILGIK